MPSSRFPTLFGLLWCLILSVSAVHVQVTSYADGSYAFTATESGGSTPSRDDLRSSVRSAYMSMVENNEGIESADTMAALHVVGKGTIYHSSIKGAGRGSAHTAGLVLNTCNVNGHRYSGNCGEMGAITDAKAKGWNVRGGYMAVYGITNKDMGTEDYMAPCHDRGGKTGCEGVTGEQGEGINCFTRRDGKSVCKSKNPPQKSPSPKTQQQKTPPQKTSPQKVPSKSKTGKKRSVVFARGTRIALGSHREI